MRLAFAVCQWVEANAQGHARVRNDAVDSTSFPKALAADVVVRGHNPKRRPRFVVELRYGTSSPASIVEMRRLLHTYFQDSPGCPGSGSETRAVLGIWVTPVRGALAVLFDRNGAGGAVQVAQTWDFGSHPITAGLSAPWVAAAAGVGPPVPAFTRYNHNAPAVPPAVHGWPHAGVPAFPTPPGPPIVDIPAGDIVSVGGALTASVIAAMPNLTLNLADLLQYMTQ